MLQGNELPRREPAMPEVKDPVDRNMRVIIHPDR